MISMTENNSSPSATFDVPKASEEWLKAEANKCLPFALGSAIAEASAKASSNEEATDGIAEGCAAVGTMAGEGFRVDWYKIKSVSEKMRETLREGQKISDVSLGGDKSPSTLAEVWDSKKSSLGSATSVKGDHLTLPAAVMAVFADGGSSVLGGSNMEGVAEKACEKGRSSVDKCFASVKKGPGSSSKHFDIIAKSVDEFYSISLGLSADSGGEGSAISGSGGSGLGW